MHCTRRHFLATAAAAPLLLRADAPTARVAVAKCPDYGTQLTPTLDKMFDQLGGLERLIKGKTVAIKVNMTGGPDWRLGYSPVEDTHYTHPRVIGAVTHLMGRAGAQRIRILEGCYSTADPLPEFMLQAGWEPRDVESAAPHVEFENTNIAGPAKKYSRLKVPGGGYMFPAFDFNHSYEDCDVFVSLAKMKNHATAGVTLSMKNCFGSTPISIYGGTAGVDEPNELPRAGRGMFHDGMRQPSKCSPGEHRPGASHDDKYRVPRIVTDIVAARPIHLAIVEGIITMAGGEGPWIPGCRVVRPGVIVAGLNPVCTDAVCTAVMGYDPMAVRGTVPFVNRDSILQLAEQAGIGTRDLRRIEVAGTPIREARFDFERARL